MIQAVGTQFNVNRAGPDAVVSVIEGIVQMSRDSRPTTAAAGERRYAAAFDADDPEALMTILEKDPHLQLEHRAGEIVVRGR